jgi:8-oxo-dGTP diphosphatase
LRLALRRPLVAAAAVALDPEGQVVLVRRRDTGTWGLPGGLLAWGERVAEAAAREVYEETGRRVEQVGRLVGVFSDPGRDPRAHSVLVVVEARLGPVLATPSPEEVIEVRAFSPDELPSQLAHSGEKVLEAWRLGATALA